MQDLHPYSAELYVAQEQRESAGRGIARLTTCIWQFYASRARERGGRYGRVSAAAPEVAEAENRSRTVTSRVCLS